MCPGWCSNKSSFRAEKCLGVVEMDLLTSVLIKMAYYKMYQLTQLNKFVISGTPQWTQI